MTHPVHQARWQVRTFRHLPPDPQHFAEIYPELLHSDDQWVKFYNEVMDSGLPVVSDAPGPEEPSAASMLRYARRLICGWRRKGWITCSR